MSPALPLRCVAPASHLEARGLRGGSTGQLAGQLKQGIRLVSHQQCPFGRNRGAGDWYAMYHHYLLRKRVKQAPLSMRRGKGTSMDPIPLLPIGIDPPRGLKKFGRAGPLHHQRPENMTSAALMEFDWRWKSVPQTMVFTTCLYLM